MKKKVIATLVAAVACVAMVFTAFAADSTQGTLVGSDNVTLGAVDTADVPEDVKAIVDKAAADQDLSAVFAGQTEISGVNLAGMKFLSQMLSFTNAAPGEKVTVTANNLTSGMKPYFLVYADGKWQLIEAEVNGTQLSAVLPEGGIVAVVYKDAATGDLKDDKGNTVTTPGNNGTTTSPKTGEAVTLPLAVLAAALVSVGLVAAKKSKASEC